MKELAGEESGSESNSDSDGDNGRGGAASSSEADARRALRLGLVQPTAKRPRVEKSVKVIGPLVKGELTGRTVLIPRSFWPEEECDGEGWPAVVKSEKYGVAMVRTPFRFAHRS